MPCQDHYADRIEYITRTIEVDKPATIKKLVDMEAMLCNVGFMLRNNPNIDWDKEQIAEILNWHKQHRREELIIILERNKKTYDIMVERVKSIRELGREVKPEMINKMKEDWNKITDLENKIRANDEGLLYNRDNDCSLEIE